MSVNSFNESHVGHQDDISNQTNVQEPIINYPHLMGGVGAILLSLHRELHDSTYPIPC